MAKDTGRPPRFQLPTQLREQLQRLKLRFPSETDEDQLEQLEQQSALQPEQQSAPQPTEQQSALQPEQQSAPQPTEQQSALQPAEQQPVLQPEQKPKQQSEQASPQSEPLLELKTGRKKTLSPEEIERLRAAYDVAYRNDPKRKQSDVFNELRNLLGRTVSDTTLRTEIVARK